MRDVRFVLIRAICSLSVFCLGGVAQAQEAQTQIAWLDDVAEPQKGATTQVQPIKAQATVTEDEGLKLKLGTSTFTRYELRRNYPGETYLPVAPAPDIDAFAYRARLDLRTTPYRIRKGLTVDIGFSPQASGYWGMTQQYSDVALGLHEGYLRTRFGDQASLQVGRFEMSYGDDWLISANSWQTTARAFDGMRFRIAAKNAAAFLDLFGAQIREGATQASSLVTRDRRFGTGDMLLLGAYGALGPLISRDFDLDFYALALIAPRTSGQTAEGAAFKRDGAAEAILGMRVKGDAGVLDYRLEGGLQVGKRAVFDTAPPSKSLAGAVDAELGFKLAEFARIAFGGQFASGDNPDTARNEAWQDYFSRHHKWLGFSDVIRRSNVFGPNLELTVTPVEGLAFGAQGHVFFFPHRQAGSPIAPADDSVLYAGTELDPYVSYAIGRGLYLRCEYAAFFPDADAFAAGPNPKTVHYLGLQFGFEHPK